VLAILTAFVVAAIIAFAVLAPGPFGRLVDAFAPSNVEVGRLTVGQCFDGAPMSGTEPELAIAVRVIDCAQPHEAELYAVLERPAGAYPGDAALTEWADLGCYERFEPYVGVAAEASSLQYAFFYPSSESWLQGDRTVQCMVVGPAGEKLTGSVRGSGR
jgi:hypothetical protein